MNFVSGLINQKPNSQLLSINKLIKFEKLKYLVGVGEDRRDDDGYLEIIFTFYSMMHDDLVA
jgi:hypothetical protein